MNPYRQRVFELIRTLMPPHETVDRVLDVGGGDGWFAMSIREAGLADEVVAVDVQARSRTYAEVSLYDGQRLPFDDRSFEMVTSFDVLHHCPAPRDTLREALRCAGRFFLLKDHTYRTRAGWLTLALLDELGNRRFGIRNRYRYQREREWFSWIEEEGFTLRGLIHPARCHVGLLGKATNSLQMIALWERTKS